MHDPINAEKHFSNLNYKSKYHFFGLSLPWTISILDTISLIVLIVLIIHKSQNPHEPGSILYLLSSNL